MQGVAQKPLKVMTESLENSGVGAQAFPMVSQRCWDPLKYLTGAHYTAHFKDEGGYISQRCLVGMLAWWTG